MGLNYGIWSEVGIIYLSDESESGTCQDEDRMESNGTDYTYLIRSESPPHFDRILDRIFTSPRCPPSLTSYPADLAPTSIRFIPQIEAPLENFHQLQISATPIMIVLRTSKSKPAGNGQMVASLWILPTKYYPVSSRSLNTENYAYTDTDTYIQRDKHRARNTSRCLYKYNFLVN